MTNERRTGNDILNSLCFWSPLTADLTLTSRRLSCGVGKAGWGRGRRGAFRQVYCSVHGVPCRPQTQPHLSHVAVACVCQAITRCQTSIIERRRGASAWGRWRARRSQVATACFDFCGKSICVEKNLRSRGVYLLRCAIITISSQSIIRSFKIWHRLLSISIGFVASSIAGDGAVKPLNVCPTGDSDRRS